LHVEHDAASCHASDGVEVSLDDLWGLPEQEGEAQDQLAQRLSIEHSAAAESVQLSGDALGGVDQLVGFCVRFRQQTERSPTAKAGLATAEADPEHRAQIGIGDGPDQHVGPARRDEALEDRSDPFPSAACTRRSSSRQPDRTVDSSSNPSSTASMSLACAGAAKSAFKAIGAPICAATATACSTSRQ